MYYNIKRLKTGLVTSYDIRPGNGEGPFLFRHFINLSITYSYTYTITYSCGNLFARWMVLAGTVPQQAGCWTCDNKVVGSTGAYWYPRRVQRDFWANAQRDGRPAEYRWRPLFNAAKFGWCPVLECRAVMMPRRESRWNLMGCPKLTKRSQPLVGRSSPYCADIWRKYCCLTSFFPIVDTCLSCENSARQCCAMVLRWRLFGSFLRPVFPASRTQHISDLHSKFAH